MKWEHSNGTETEEEEKGKKGREGGGRKESREREKEGGRKKEGKKKKWEEDWSTDDYHGRGNQKSKVKPDMQARECQLIRNLLRS